MKIQKNEISNKLKKLKSIAASNLEYKVILLDGNMLKAFSPEMQATYELTVKSIEKFVIPLTAIDAIESMPDGEITLTGSKKRVYIEGDGVKSSFPTLSIDKAVDFEIADDETSLFTYDGEAVEEAINKTLYACLPNTVRPQLGGLYFGSEGGKLNIVGCDGYRCSWTKLNYDGDIQAIIPKGVLQKLLSDGLEKEMKIFSCGKNKIVFKNGDFALYANLLEGAYIDYKRLFDAEKPIQFTVKRVDLLNATARIIKCQTNITTESVLLTGAEQNINISLHKSNNTLEECLPLVDGSAGELKIALNPRYLYEILKSSEEDNITFKAKDEKSAVVVYDDDIMALIMPMRI